MADTRRFCRSRVWVVDPVDGTEDFIARTGEFAVMIGLLVEGRPCLGVVYQPTVDLLYYAASGVGAFMNRCGRVSPLRVSQLSEVPKMRLVSSRSHPFPVMESIRQALGIQAHLRHGSAGLKVGLICRQLADLYINPGMGSKEWDVCAPEAILVEAGGILTDLVGAPTQYNREDVHMRRGILASNGACHGRIVATLSQVLPASLSGEE
jgi:3'(2'), 5'-bisphosphate nucleotidase